MQFKTETAVGLFVALALGIFFYMTFHIGVFRLDWRDYNPYVVYFSEISGLQKKADVKIAGVKVGWVESIQLLQSEEMQVKAHIMVNRQYRLYRNATAVVRQEGVLGGKYLEVCPGDPMLAELGSGESFTRPGRPPVNLDELFQKFKNIATNVEDITTSLKDVVGSGAKEDLRTMVNNFSDAAANMSNLSERLDQTIAKNEENFSNLLDDMRGLARKLNDGWPSVQQSIEEVTAQVKDSVRSFGDVADKINSGQGLIGKLVTEDETYHDIKTAVAGVKNYFAKVDRLGIVFDSHSETMWGVAETFKDHLDHHVDKRDAKGYFGVRVHPNEDRFYVVQACASRKGSVERYIEHYRFSKEVGQIDHMCTGVTPPIVDVSGTATSIRILDPQCREITIQNRAGHLKFNLQMAKTFKDLALRFGLFENSAGVGLDYDMSFRNGRYRWVTTFECFDFFGDNRIADARPHLKWLNRVFMFHNFYLTFGADDFISRHNANAFAGFGVRFADDDVKYIVSRFGGPSMS